jgi:hypothetical protein
VVIASDLINCRGSIPRANWVAAKIAVVNVVNARVAHQPIAARASAFGHNTVPAMN